MFSFMAKRSPRQVSFHDFRLTLGRGGPRKGAGRKVLGRRCDPRWARERFDGTTPVHVTLRVKDHVPALCSKAFMAEIRKGFLAIKERTDFRILHYSFQADHVHLIVEADDQDALGRGMKAVNARIARCAQRVFEISGRVLSGRYHTHFLGTPMEVFRAIAYVLMNLRKHYRQRHGRAPSSVWLDENSSARWFEGFSHELAADRPGEREVGRPRSWLLKKGWKRHGLTDPEMIPGSA